MDDQTIYQGVKITKLKPKKKRAPRNARRINTTCPYCLSTLKVNDVGTYECTADRLKIWETEFIKFNKMSDKEKVDYLYKFSYPDKFEELYQRWNFTDDKGNRINYDCGYTNKLFNPISRFRTTMPDPALTKTIEESLGRKLTDEELMGEVEIYRKGNSYFSDWKKGRNKVRIPILTFPDDF